MPDWLVQILIQYPIVVVIGFIAWYSYRELKEAHIGRLKREEETHADSIARQKDALRDLIAAKDAEILRLKDDYRKDVDRLIRKVDELNRRLGS